LLFGGLAALVAATRWANDGRTLVWIVALAFISRLAVGAATYLALPVDGYDDVDDRAGYVFTDAHRRDNQAWDLASSDRFIFNAFSQKYAYDQYGGLLALSALIYRYLSPDAHRPLMLVLLSALTAALGLPFLWKASSQLWGERVALISGWIFALYPESLLLGGSAMREPYLMTFSVFSLWGFVEWQNRHGRNAWIWLGFGVLGMLLVSPVVALVTIIIFAGWVWFTSERGRAPWWVIVVAVLIFTVGLFLLSSALNRSGDFNSASPLHIISDWLKLAVRWDVYKLERGSGWVQKLFDEMPAALRLPFVVVYGIFQPVLPAAFVEPTTLTWRVIGIARALGWYILLPFLLFAFVAAWNTKEPARHRLWLWLTVISWGWILFTSLRGGGDQWDNPRYRAILFLWQALAAGYAFVWWRETRNAWFARNIAMEVAFLLVFTQWYASRYFHWGGQLPFARMVALILGLWVAIAGVGWWLDLRRRA